MIKSVLSNEAQGEGGVEGRVGLNVNKTKTDFGNSILNIECVICNMSALTWNQARNNLLLTSQEPF